MGDELDSLAVHKLQVLHSLFSLCMLVVISCEQLLDWSILLSIEKIFSTSDFSFVCALWYECSGPGPIKCALL